MLYDHEIEVVPPRTNLKLLCCYNFDKNNGCVDEWEIYLGDDVFDPVGLFVETSRFGSFDPVIERLQDFLVEKMTDDGINYYVDEIDFQRYSYYEQLACDEARGK